MCYQNFALQTKVQNLDSKDKKTKSSDQDPKPDPSKAKVYLKSRCLNIGYIKYGDYIGEPVVYINAGGGRHRIGDLSVSITDHNRC